MAVNFSEVWGRVKNVCAQNGLLILSVLAVVIGCMMGFHLRGKQLSDQVSVKTNTCRVSCSFNQPTPSLVDLKHPGSPVALAPNPPPTAGSLVGRALGQ